MLQDIIKAYLYQQYNDDDNVRSFFTAYNAMALDIYQWMTNANLPIFAGNYNSGPQLRWIAKGIYGQDFPVIATSKSVVYGPYNRLRFNQLPYNGRKKLTRTNQVTTSDDVFKRIMTWNFYKGDGFHFTIPWLKRRIMRFLTGINGSDVVNDQQYRVSVKFTANGEMTISIFRGYRSVSGGATYGLMTYGNEQIGYVGTTVNDATSLDYAPVLKQVFDNGLLHMPFWASTTINVIG